MKRFASILIDFVIILAAVFCLVLLVSNTLYEPLGYNSCTEYMKTVNSDSKLYYENEDRFISLVNMYDSTKDNPEEYFDPVISNFYLTNQKAIQENKFQKYCQAKLESDIYTLNENGEYIKIKDVSDARLLDFYKTQYKKALTYLHSDAEYIRCSNYTYMIFIFSYLFNSIISASIFYLLIPMLKKRRRNHWTNDLQISSCTKTR